MNTATAGITISPVNMEDRKDIGIKAGDTVRVHQKIEERGKTRIQMFEGLVLARKHGNEPGATFTVRKMASGVGVEKIFPLYSPMIDKIEVVRRSKVRRAKLYYIREKVAREIKRQMRRMQMMTLATESETEAAVRAEEARRAEEEMAKAETEEKAAEETKQEETVEEIPTETPSEEQAETKTEESEPEKEREEIHAEDTKEEPESEKETVEEKAPEESPAESEEEKT